MDCSDSFVNWKILSPPQRLLPDQVPMFFSIGFDDNSISGIEGSGGTGGMSWILDFLRNKKNPVSLGNILTYDSTPIRVSFFNSSKYQQNFVVDNPVYVKRSWNTALIDGHEIGIHTVNHLHGSEFNTTQWSTEIGDTFDHLIKPFALNELLNFPSATSGMGADPLKITGFRTPFLEYNDEMFSVLVQQGYSYDSSIEEGWEYTIDGSNYPWPYTLDSGSPGNQYMLDSGFPNKESLSSHPGLWELGVNPLVVPPDDSTLQYGVNYSIRDKVKDNMPWFDLEGGKITGFDYNLWGLAKLNKIESLATLKYTLDLRLQNGNRAPFMLGAHTDYFGSKNASIFPQISVRERQEVIEEFIIYAQSKPEVRIVPFISILNWMRNPSAIDCSVNCSTAPLPPMLINPGNQSSEIDSAIELTIEATDPNGLELNFSAENLPAGLSINPVSGLISGIAFTEGLNRIIVKVNNGEKTSTITFNWKIDAIPNGSTNLVAHWPLNEGTGVIAGDKTQQGHNGTLINNPVWNGTELLFDGIDDYVNVGTLDISGSALTLAGWVQADALENCASHDCRILSKAVSTSGQDHYWMISPIKTGGSTRLRFRLKAGGTTTTLVASTGDLFNGERFHVAAVYDGTTMRLYKDGVEVGSRAKTGAIDTNAGVEAWIGGNPTIATSRPWKGSIGDVRIYQTALTAVDVNSVMNTGTITRDITPPVISNIQTSVTDSTATITWDSNESASSLVDYGLTASYGDTNSIATLTTSHSLTLTGLTPGTLYHYQVGSSDANGNSTSSIDLTLTTSTTVDNTPPVISNIQALVTDNTATITWNTNEAANSLVDYGLTNGYGESNSVAALVTAHRLTLTGLTPGTLYHYRVGSSDANGNSTSSIDLTLTTNTTVDNTPPVISNIQALVTDNTATITWNTNETANSLVDYGLTNGYGESNSVAALVTAHSLTLTGLTPETLYYYQVSSIDASNNMSGSFTDNLIFTTATTPDNSDDLVAHWPLNEGTGVIAGDKTQQGHNGTLINNPVWNGTELLFDGIDDYVNVGTLDIPGSALTLVGWVQADALENCASHDCRILSKAVSTSGQDHYWMISPIKTGGSTRLRFRLKAGGTTTTLVASSGDLFNGERFHVAAVYDGTTMRLYKDGVEVGSRAKTGAIDTNAGVEAWIGANPTIATSRPWKGSIADVRIYQTALTAVDVNSVMNTGTITRDITPPVISNIQTSVTNSTATITWDSNESASSLVGYGLTASYGDTNSIATLTTSHSLTLTGLTPGTLYHYQVGSSDANGNSTSSIDLIFTTNTTVDNTPPVISNIQASVTDSSATITWDSNESASSLVGYGLTASYGDTNSMATLTTSHSLTLTGLTPETLYHYQVGSSDANGNSNISIDLTFTTNTTVDNTPPLISNIQASVTDSTAAITWDSNESASSLVDYGLTASYGDTNSIATLTTSHSLTLTGLTPGTLYHYQVGSSDANGNSTSSIDLTLTTSTTADNTPPVISNIQASVTDSTATITWNTNEVANSLVDYGLTNGYGESNFVAALVTAHSLTLTGLTPETLYYYQVSSIDASNNMSGSFTDNLIFTTATTPDNSDDLVAHWPLNEGTGVIAGDKSQQGHNGTLINNPVWNGTELLFDGIDDYVNVGTLDIPGSALTLVGWVQADALENCASHDCRILSKAVSTSGQDHYWMISPIKTGGSTRLRFRLKAGGTTTTLVASSGDLFNGERFHVAAVYDGTTMRLYKDGVEVGSRAKTGAVDTNAGVEAWIGANPTIATSRPWKGSIADVRIYQTTLTAVDVNSVMNAINVVDNSTAPTTNN